MTTKKKKVQLLDIIPIIILVALIIIFAIISGGTSLSRYNVGNVIVQIVPTLIGALGVVFVVALGGTDISIGASAAMCATIGTLLAVKTGVSWLMVPVTLVLTMLVGLAIGTLVSKCKVSSFMLTLAILIAARGFLNFMLSKDVIYTPAGLEIFSTTWFAIVLLIIAVVVVYFVFEKTAFGYYCKCIGENERTVRSVGINVDKIRIICFIISGLFAGIVGITQLCRVGGSTNTLCNMLEMRVQMAIFLGGILTTGGFSAKLYKVIIGSITITVIENGLTICQVSSSVSEAIEGILLVIILCTTIYFNNVSERHAVKLSMNDTTEVVE